MDLAIATSRENERAVLTLTGSVDLANRDDVVTAGQRVLADQPPTSLVVDLAEVTFFDSSGIGVLVTLAGDSQDAKVAFSIRSPSAPVARVLDISGLLRVWTVE